MAADEAHKAIEAVFRIERARLIAGLARMVRDVDRAEELAQEALLIALAEWPRTGVPGNPGAWLMAAAKRRAIDGIRRYPLGPSLGQCCGGVVFLSYRRITAVDAPALQRELVAQLKPVALCGGGHVGAALARLLAGLPFSVRWIDSRDGVFPDALPAQIETEHSEPVQDAVAALENEVRATEGALLEELAQLLDQQDLPALAAERVRSLMFIARFRSDIAHKLEKIEP